MKYLYFLSLSALFSSCSSMPQFFQAAEQIATDTAIKIEISKETIQEETDLEVCVNVTNQEHTIQHVRKDK